MTAAALATELAAVRWPGSLDEYVLQHAVGQALQHAGHVAVPEVWLSARDRIDFVVAGQPPVGIEVKVAGSCDRVQAQLGRYAASPSVGELLLVTSKARHRALHGQTLHGKPVHVVLTGQVL